MIPGMIDIHPFDKIVTGEHIIGPITGPIPNSLVVLSDDMTD